MGVVLVDGLVDRVGQLHHLDGPHAAAGLVLLLGRVVRLGEQRRQNRQHDVEEREKAQADDHGEEQVAVEGVADLEATIDAEAVVHVAEAGVHAIEGNE